MTASINHEWGGLVSRYLGETVKGVLGSLQHAAGPLLLREEQFSVEIEQSRELGQTGVSTGRTQDFTYHSNSAAALGIKQKMDEGASKKVIAGIIFDDDMMIS